MSVPPLRIEYDDQPNDVVDRVNRVLAEVGLKFVEDEQALVGILVYELQGPRVALEASAAKMRAALQELKTRALTRAPGAIAEFSPATAVAIALICEQALG